MTDLPFSRDSAIQTQLWAALVRPWLTKAAQAWLLGAM
jgi:hypothetical protein